MFKLQCRSWWQICKAIPIGLITQHKIYHVYETHSTCIFISLLSLIRSTSKLHIPRHVIVWLTSSMQMMSNKFKLQSKSQMMPNLLGFQPIAYNNLICYYIQMGRQWIYSSQNMIFATAWTWIHIDFYFCVTSHKPSAKEILEHPFVAHAPSSPTFATVASAFQLYKLICFSSVIVMYPPSHYFFFLP